MAKAASAPKQVLIPNGPKEKVCVVGSAEPSLSQTPWDDGSFDIWCLAWRNVPRAEAYFDIHSIGSHRKRIQENYLQRLAGFKVPVYLQRTYEEVPNSIAYPYDEIVKFLNGFDPYAKSDYFCSSIAYMFALAMYKEYKEIHIYGVNLIDDEEYTHQKPNLEYLIGLARGRGIKVFVPDSSALLKASFLYGYQEHLTTKQVITEDFLKHRIKQYNDVHHEALAKAYLADGAMQEAKQLQQILKANQRGLAADVLKSPDPYLKKEGTKK